MNTAFSHIAKESSSTEDTQEEKKIIFWETVNIVLKSTGMITWFFIFLITLLELKRYFNFDLIPGYNSAIDDAYNAFRFIIMQ